MPNEANLLIQSQSCNVPIFVLHSHSNRFNEREEGERRGRREKDGERIFERIENT